MKKLKQYFKMIITAVICFAMSFVPGKKSGAKTEKVLAQVNGQAVSGCNKKSRFHVFATVDVLGRLRSVSDVCGIFRRSSFLKKVFYWMQGPGDRNPLCYESSG